MNAFLYNLIEDLRAFATDMLETGLAPSARLDLGDVRAPSVAGLLSVVSNLSALVPVLLDELEESEAPDRVTMRYGHRPVRGRPSRHPADYQRSMRQEMVPTRWVSTVPVLEPDRPALAWLYHLVAVQQELLDSVRERTHKQIEEARIARRGTSLWALADEQDLSSLQERLDQAHLRLRRAATLVRRAAGGPLRPTERLPAAYPRTPAWVRLRQMARDLTEPERALPNQLRAMLDAQETADVPYLYQRWCGVKLLQAFEELGWRITGDPVGPLLLGGCIRLAREGEPHEELLEIWVEARLTPDRDHPSGFCCAGEGEVTPDFLVIAKGPSRYDAFVLDATMTGDQEVILNKGKYLSQLRSAQPGYAAGLEVYYRPRRSWAAAPIHGGLSRIFDLTAGWGVIPMNPGRYRRAPLRAWVLDVDRYSRAWSAVEDDPRFRRRRRPRSPGIGESE